MEPPPVPARQKEPNDGPGPRGVPDCYYKSRVLNSTFRYVRFVKKLRMMEEEHAKGLANKMKELKDQQISDFFIRCDRRSLINGVARRVDLCLRSYEADLAVKKNRLKELLAKEEEENIRLFVMQAQAGREAIWKEKMERLQHLLAKRKKEHEEKYKDTPLSKCVHVLPCIYKLRAKEAQQIQLYQMREKEAKQLTEAEYEHMWHEVAMKEAEALSARMEQDAIERYRRDLECKEHSDMIVAQREKQRERDREMLKREQKMLREKFDEDLRKEMEAEAAVKEKRMQIARERDDTLRQRQEMLAKQQAEADLIEETWDSLAGQGLAEEKAQLDHMRRKEKELDHCNKQLIKLRDEIRREDKDDAMFEAEAKRQQDVIDKKRCDYLLWSQKTNRDVRKAMVEQIKDNNKNKEELRKKLEEQEEYHRQLWEQQSALLSYKEKMDAEKRKNQQKDLLKQIEYNKLLKERARQEELDQIKKGKIAAQEYQDEIKRMLCRPFFSEDVHPFMRQMAQGLEMKKTCPCSKPTHCKDCKVVA